MMNTRATCNTKNRLTFHVISLIICPEVAAVWDDISSHSRGRMVPRSSSVFGSAFNFACSLFSRRCSAFARSSGVG